MTASKSFVWAYRSGLLAATAVMLSAVPEIERWFDVPNFAAALFAVGIGHMVALVAIGWFFSTQAQRRACADRLQTAGYLHTLIGFATALLVARSGEFGQLLGPLGSALGTSIIGWFVGGEFENGGSGDPTAIGPAKETLTAELTGFASAIRLVHEEYLKTLNGLVAKHAELGGKHEKALEEMLKASTSLHGSVSGIASDLRSLKSDVEGVSKETKIVVGAIKEVADGAEMLRGALMGAAAGAVDVSRYLKDSRVLIEELGKVAELVASAGGRSET